MATFLPFPNVIKTSPSQPFPIGNVAGTGTVGSTTTVGNAITSRNATPPAGTPGTQLNANKQLQNVGGVDGKYLSEVTSFSLGTGGDLISLGLGDRGAATYIGAGFAANAKTLEVRLRSVVAVSAADWAALQLALTQFGGGALDAIVFTRDRGITGPAGLTTAASIPTGIADKFIFNDVSFAAAGGFTGALFSGPQPNEVELTGSAVVTGGSLYGADYITNPILRLDSSSDGHPSATLDTAVRAGAAQVVYKIDGSCTGVAGAPSVTLAAGDIAMAGESSIKQGSVEATAGDINGQASAVTGPISIDCSDLVAGGSYDLNGDDSCESEITGSTLTAGGGTSTIEITGFANIEDNAISGGPGGVAIIAEDLKLGFNAFADPVVVSASGAGFDLDMEGNNFADTFTHAGGAASYARANCQGNLYGGVASFAGGTVPTLTYTGINELFTALGSLLGTVGEPALTVLLANAALAANVGVNAGTTNFPNATVV